MFQCEQLKNKVVTITNTGQQIKPERQSLLYDWGTCYSEGTSAPAETAGYMCAVWKEKEKS